MKTFNPLNLLNITLLILLVGFLLCGMTAMAQSSTKGTISGKVLDESGTPLPGVTVTLIHQTQGTRRTVVTNEDGKYRAPLLALVCIPSRRNCRALPRIQPRT